MKKTFLVPIFLMLAQQAYAIERIFLTQGDVLPAYQVFVVDASGLPVDLTGCTITATMRMDGNTINAFANSPALVSSPPTSGAFSFFWNSTQTATSGAYTIQFTVNSPGGVYTLPSGTLAPVKIVPKY